VCGVGEARYQEYIMKSWCIIIGLMVLVFVSSCEKKEPEINGPEKRNGKWIILNDDGKWNVK